MESTLHDFVLNLLSDPQALTAFSADPEGALNSVGLGDISAADVHDAFPLVLDYAPAHAVAGLESALGALPLDSLESGQAGAIQQLQVFTQAISQATSISGQFANPVLGISGAGSFAGDPQHGYTVGAELSSPLGTAAFSATSVGLNDLPSHFTSAGDLTSSLDATAAGVTGGFTATNSLGSAAAATALTPALADPTAALNPATLADALTSNTGDVNAVLPGGIAAPVTLPTVPAGVIPTNLPQLPGTDAVQSATAAAHSVVSTVTDHSLLSGNPLDGVGQVTDTLHTAESSVTSVTGELHQGTGGLDTVTSTAHSAITDVTGAVAHSPVGDVAGTSSVTDVTGHVTSDLSSVTDHLAPADLHLPF